MNNFAPQNEDPNFWKVWRETDSPQDAMEEKTYPEAWWLRVTTQEVEYYFGPFAQQCDVAMKRSGFIKDLYDARITVIETEILWCQPTDITVNLKTANS